MDTKVVKSTPCPTGAASGCRGGARGFFIYALSQTRRPPWKETYHSPPGGFVPVSIAGSIPASANVRWSVEVYFKEIKQNLGFLKEQSGRYQLAYASVNLAAVRYLLLFEAMLRAGQLSYGEIRDRESGRLQTLTYAALLWQLFRALIEGALEGLVRELGRKVIKKVLAAINQTVEGFLTEALQISPQYISAQLKAEEFGYL